MVADNAAKEDGEAKPGIYRGDPVKTPAPVITVTKPPVELIKLDEFVSAEFRKRAEESMQKVWNQALGIWGQRIGLMPRLTFNIYRANTIGLARLTANEIALNPLWCILAEEHPNIEHEMLVETMTHEIAHIVAWNFSKERGHGTGWIMAMKLLGAKPDVFLEPGKLPSWTEGYKEFLELKRKELIGKNADLADSFDNRSDDEQE